MLGIPVPHSPSVPNSRCPVPGAQCLVSPVPQCLIPGAQSPVPAAQFPVLGVPVPRYPRSLVPGSSSPSAQFLLPGARFLIPGAQFPVPGSLVPQCPQCLVPDCWCLVPSSQCPAVLWGLIPCRPCCPVQHRARPGALGASSGLPNAPGDSPTPHGEQGQRGAALRRGLGELRVPPAQPPCPT